MISKSKMEAETLSLNHPPSFLCQSLPAVVPMLLISTVYVDPGKWVATVEDGARFGFDLMGVMLIFNSAAIFCQYISARIGAITGKSLAQICSDEYDTWTCMLLGVQTELSVIMLTRCVFLAATSVVFHILLSVLLDIEKAKILGQFVAGFVLLSFILGLLINQPEVPFSMNGIPGEGAFVLMSLPGANLVPHNFYLHSSIVQGIIDPAFLKPHSPLDPCFCLQVQRKLSPHLSNGMLPPTTKPGQGKYTTASTLLELIKEVELAISGRKGRTGTAAGDVAFPKGKENLASVLKRYKQRLSNKPIGTNGGTGSRKIPTLASYNQ